MGAGAGYTIETDQVSLDGDILIDSFDVNPDGEWLVTTVNCNVSVLGSVRANSYYNGCDWIKDVPMMVTNIVINFLRTDEYPDVTEDMIREVLENTSNYIGEGSYGGGWSHAKFDGIWEMIPNNSYDDVESVTLQIKDEYINDYIDLAVQGDNIEYNAWFNGEYIDTATDKDEAIAVLKNAINDAIAEGGPEAVDFSDCYVEYGYWQLLNGNGESDVDYPSNNFEYSADSDPDYADYI